MVVSFDYATGKNYGQIGINLRIKEMSFYADTLKNLFSIALIWQPETTDDIPANT